MEVKKDPRIAYGETLVELGEENNRIVVLEADLRRSTMTYLFQQRFPERFFEMGIAEQNMVSFAAGLALTGKIVFVNSFAVFTCGRPYDQIRQSVCTARLNVKIVGSSAGLSDFGDGATHQAIEDLALMRALPNMTVLVPVDSVETRKAVKAAAECEGPVYIRINRNEMPILCSEDMEFKIGEPTVIREGEDIVIFGCGIMVSKALNVAEKLRQEGISVRVVNVSSLKPVNEEKIKGFVKGMKGVIVVEEHSIIGGLTSLITYILRGENIPVESVAIMDRFGQSAWSYEELLEEYGLTEENIISKVNSILKK